MFAFLTRHGWLLPDADPHAPRLQLVLGLVLFLLALQIAFFEF